jgi:hypothetical protein
VLVAEDAEAAGSDGAALAGVDAAAEGATLGAALAPALGAVEAPLVEQAATASTATMASTAADHRARGRDVGVVGSLVDRWVTGSGSSRDGSLGETHSGASEYRASVARRVTSHLGTSDICTLVECD